MSDRRGRAASVDTAIRTADRRRHLELSQQPPYAPLPLTHNRLNGYMNVLQSDNAFSPGQHKPNISKLQALEFNQARRQPLASYFSLPTKQERNALLINARRARSVDARYAATVDTRGDIASPLALHPMHWTFSRPLWTKDLWPGSCTEESSETRAGLFENATQPELRLPHKGASVNPTEPATADSEALMEGLFDFDGAIESIETIGQAKEAGLAIGVDGGGARDTEGDDVMQEL